MLALKIPQDGIGLLRPCLCSPNVLLQSWLPALAGEAEVGGWTPTASEAVASVAGRLQHRRECSRPSEMPSFGQVSRSNPRLRHRRREKIRSPRLTKAQMMFYCSQDTNMARVRLLLGFRSLRRSATPPRHFSATTAARRSTISSTSNPIPTNHRAEIPLKRLRRSSFPSR